jgi:hypothetical protein
VECIGAKWSRKDQETLTPVAEGLCAAAAGRTKCKERSGRGD